MVQPQDGYLKFGPYLDLMTGIRTALSINEGIIKVVASEGCGKTSLCRQLANDLANTGQEVIFFESPPESVEFLHKRIQSELDLPRDKNFTRSLTNYLLTKSPPNNKLILIYDDAEKISKDIFILIRLLNNIHDKSDTLVSQVICGTSKLDKVFDDPDLRSLTQYLNQSFTLLPMSREDLQDCYSVYKKQSGLTGRDMSNKELTDLFMVGKGLPGITLELLEKHFRTGSDQPVEAATDNEPAPAIEADTEYPAAVTAHEPAVSQYASEVEEILNEDVPRKSFTPVYFKSVLSVLVITASIILAVVLSGENEIENERVAEILADDSPLYLDELAPGEIPEVATAPAETDSVDVVAIETVAPQSEPVLAEVNVEEAIPAIDQTEKSAAVEPEIASVTSLPSPPIDMVLGNRVQNWLEAWANGDYAGYLAVYHDAFESANHDSRRAWESERESRINGVTGINVSHDRFELLEENGDEATVRFWMYYSRGSYADETLKEIVFRRENGNWLILSESNLDLIVR